MIDLDLFANIMAMVRTVFPGLHVLDAHVPHASLFWWHEDVVTVVSPDSFRNDDQTKFYARFRQRGGHLPLLPIADVASHLHAHRRARVAKDSNSLIFLDADHIGALATAFTDMPPRTRLLVYRPETVPLDTIELALPQWPQVMQVRFARAGSFEHFYLMADEIGPDLQADIIAAAKPFAIEIYIEPRPAPWIVAAIRIDLPNAPLKVDTLGLTAASLIHDGSRRSEATGDYSWLWVGAEQHIRILLGAIPDSFNRVRVIVPKAFSSANLRAAKLLLNGRRVETQVELWDDGVGAVAAALTERDAPLVLGFSVPSTVTLEDGTKLAACIDKVELLV